MTVITRFAPSPTGFLHIGGARTALFNWLFAKHHDGKFLLRIEDTDKKRSTNEAIDAILDGMKWLGLEWNEDVIYQSKQEKRHKEIADELLAQGKAYKCYCTPEELAEMREQAQKEGRAFRYNGKWRDKDESEAPEGISPAIRLKAPLEGETVIEDLVQGTVTIPNEEIDDLILLRSDGTPTYMLAVVVDDHDMNITHAIRGDDHLTNAFRQKAIYDALGWDTPIFAHIPLIHGPDGAKMSKRHGALGVDAYREMGYLPEALRNYLLRLGWSHGDDEIISTEQAIEWFNTESIGKSPARFDFDKLANLNGHYIKESDNEELITFIKPIIEGKIGTIDELSLARIKKGLSGLKERSKTTIELAESALFYVKRLDYDEKAKEVLNDGGKEVVEGLIPELTKIDNWQEEALKDFVKQHAELKELKLGKIAQPLRAALAGTMTSPGIFEVMDVLGKDESLERLSNI